MRLSDAIALGRTLVHPVPGILLDRSGLNGCALGMGYKANGGAAKVDALDYGVTINAAFNMWEWLSKRCIPPCGCEGEIMSMGQCIAHIFDYHIMAMLTPPWESLPEDRWTLDQLIDWIRSVEPQETATEIPSIALESAQAKSCEEVMDAKT